MLAKNFRPSSPSAAWVIPLLPGLPDKPFAGIRGLWYELGHIPIGA
jgi:hypothetical protein